MADELTLNEQKAMEDLSQVVAKQLAEGKSKKHIVKELVKQQWSQEAAGQFVDEVEQAIKTYQNSPEGRAALAGQYARRMLYGVLWAVGGTIVTVASYEAASAGGTYIIAWGAILFGIIDFLRGLFGWLKYQG
jgi:hypothetical protein